MKTKINIGTNKGNFQNIEINKPFNKIKIKDIYNVLKEKLESCKGIKLHGWCDVTNL